MAEWGLQPAGGGDMGGWVQAAVAPLHEQRAGAGCAGSLHLPLPLFHTPEESLPFASLET